MNSGLMLEDIVNVKILNEIQHKFTAVTGVCCVIANTDGKPITDISSYTKFCKYLRSQPCSRQKCEDCDKKAGLEAMRRGEAIFYTCHAGLIDAAAPIVVNNQYMGAFLCGQVFLTGNRTPPEVIREKTADLNIDQDLLLEYIDEIEVVSQDKLMNALEMMTLMTNYIVEMGVSNLTQKQLMTEMKAKSDLENVLRETEYKALQAQINPHFLFNCLNTIGRVALTEGAYQTQELIYSISDILRSILKHSDKIIPLKDELKYVKDYLAIQQARFGDRIKVSFEIDEFVLGVRLPKFSLQPLVENAIVHGLEPKKEGGSLTLKAGREGDNAVIEISDTGVGMPAFKINDILNSRNENTSGHTTGLGITNVLKRIQYYFGENYGLQINSNVQQGCKVKVIIPFLE